MWAGRTVLSITAIGYEVSSDDTASSEWIAALAKSAIGVDCAGAVVGVIGVARGT